MPKPAPLSSHPDRTCRHTYKARSAQVGDAKHKHERAKFAQPSFFRNSRAENPCTFNVTLVHTHFSNTLPRAANSSSRFCSENKKKMLQASAEHVGEPLLTGREITRALEERLRAQRGLQRRLREVERGSLQTCFKGPGEVGKRYECAQKPRAT